jgi:dihydroorotase
MSKKINIIKPFDAHLHLRVDKMAELVAPMSANQFSDVVVMPNLQPPVKTVDEALDYKKRLKGYADCNYHMALYLTEGTSIEEIQKAAENPNIIGFKLYPMNATTGSQDGISDIKNVYHLFAEMEKLRVPLMIHGEVTRPEVDIFDREKIFIEEVLTDIVKTFPKIKITLEHITTEDAVQFVMNHDIVATITAHHLMINRNAIFTVAEKTALNPHNFCLPIAKAEKHRKALLIAAMSGNSKFFAGTDSAPHPLSCKESSCGCAGCFTGLHAVEMYTTAFVEWKQESKLEDFLSIFGRIHYGIDIPDENITIEEHHWEIPKTLGENGLTPFMACKTLEWKVEGA